MQTEKQTAEPVAAGSAAIEDPNRVGLLFARETVAHRPDHAHAGGFSAASLALALTLAASSRASSTSSSSESPPAIERDVDDHDGGSGDGPRASALVELVTRVIANITRELSDGELSDGEMPTRAWFASIERARLVDFRTRWAIEDANAPEPIVTPAGEGVALMRTLLDVAAVAGAPLELRLALELGARAFAGELGGLDALDRKLEEHFPLKGFEGDTNTPAYHIVQDVRGALALGMHTAGGERVACFVRDVAAGLPDARLDLLEELPERVLVEMRAIGPDAYAASECPCMAPIDELCVCSAEDRARARLVRLHRDRNAEILELRALAARAVAAAEARSDEPHKSSAWTPAARFIAETVDASEREREGRTFVPELEALDFEIADTFDAIAAGTSPATASRALVLALYAIASSPHVRHQIERELAEAIGLSILDLLSTSWSSATVPPDVAVVSLQAHALSDLLDVVGEELVDGARHVAMTALEPDEGRYHAIHFVREATLVPFASVPLGAPRDRGTITRWLATYALEALELVTAAHPWNTDAGLDDVRRFIAGRSGAA